VSHVRTIRIHLGMPDSTGRQTPQEIANSHVNIDADLAITALGFAPRTCPRVSPRPISASPTGDTQDRLAQHDDQHGGACLPPATSVRGASLVVWRCATAATLPSVSMPFPRDQGRAPQRAWRRSEVRRC